MNHRNLLQFFKVFSLFSFATAPCIAFAKQFPSAIPEKIVISSGKFYGTWKVALDKICVQSGTGSCIARYYHPIRTRKRNGVVSLYILNRETSTDGTVNQNLDSPYSVSWVQYNCAKDEYRSQPLATYKYDNSKQFPGAARTYDYELERMVLRPGQKLVLIDGKRYWEATDWRNPEAGNFGPKQKREFSEWSAMRPGSNGAADLDWYCRNIRQEN